MTPAVAVHDSDKAEAILTAALELFVERGFHGTSVPSVAERAKVAAGTIYHYFASKDALVNALYKRWKQALMAEIMASASAGPAPREQFRNVWMGAADFAIRHPNELAFLELHHHASYLDDESIATERSAFEFGVMFVSQAQAIHALRDLPPAILLEFVEGAFLGVFRAGIEKRLPLTRETFEQAEQCAWEAVRA